MPFTSASCAPALSAARSSSAVVYQSPAAGEAATTRTLPATTLGIATDPCEGHRSVDVAITVVVTRAGVTKTYTGASGHSWPGQAPPHPPDWCFEPPPEPEPEPDPMPDLPPIGDIQPWKCPEDP